MGWLFSRSTKVEVVMISPICHGFNGLTNTITHISIGKDVIAESIKVDDFKSCQILVKAFEKCYWQGRADMHAVVKVAIDANTPKDLF